MKVLKEKEIAMKRPIFACVSATMEMGKAVNLRALEHDVKRDDCYLQSSDAEEQPPPGDDNIGRERKLIKKATVVGKQAVNEVRDKIDNMLLTIGIKSGRELFRRPTGLSKRLSNQSINSRKMSNANGGGDRSSQASGSPLRKRRTGSAKKRAMEKKLKAYYQTLIEPAGKYGYQHDKETMLDGTDVDAQIRKKRAH